MNKSALLGRPHFAEEAKKRMVAGGGNHGNQYTKEKLAGMEQCPTPSKYNNNACNENKSRDKAASAVGISGKTLSAV